MELSRQNFWTGLVLAIILVSLVIVIIFIFINVCISKRAARYRTQAKPNHYDGTHYKKECNQVYHKDLENEKPPLPPRDQFMDPAEQDYEDVEQALDYVVVEESTSPAAQQPIFTPHYTTVEKKSQDQDSEDYDDVEILANDSGEDYDDVEIPANDDCEDYDDIG